MRLLYFQWSTFLLAGARYFPVSSPGKQVATTWVTTALEHLHIQGSAENKPHLSFIKISTCLHSFCSFCVDCWTIQASSFFLTLKTRELRAPKCRIFNWRSASREAKISHWHFNQLPAGRSLLVSTNHRFFQGVIAGDHYPVRNKCLLTFWSRIQPAKHVTSLNNLEYVYQ